MFPRSGPPSFSSRLLWLSFLEKVVWLVLARDDDGTWAHRELTRGRACTLNQAWSIVVGVDTPHAICERRLRITKMRTAAFEL